MTSVYFHEGETAVALTDGYVGNPMYGVVSEHWIALILVGVLIAGSRLIRKRLANTAYAGLDHPHRMAFWLLLASAVVHFGLVLGHGLDGYTVLYAAGTILLAAATWLMLRGGRGWRPIVATAPAVSLLAYVIVMVAGETPDQVGLATKLAELTALAILFAPRTTRTRFRLIAVNGLTIFLFLLVGVSGWIGAFSGGGGHHLGDVPTPGVLLPIGDDRDPTPAEQAAHDLIVAEVIRHSAQYADLAVAAAAGYDVADISGSDYHAANEAFKSDDYVFDPERPENLIYGIADSGEPVLLGVMFEMEKLRQAGPAPGGPLTVWHAHDHICFTVTGLGPLVSPWGGCPIGHIAVPMTNEMLHIWTVPNADEPVGELEDWERDAYLSSR